MSKLVFLFVCVAALQVASALQCYSCQGAECDKELKTWDKKTCGVSGTTLPKGYEYRCLKLKYKDAVSKQPMVLRKCFSTEVKDGKPIINCPTTYGEPIDCPVCHTELCNSAPSINFSFLAFSGVILAFLAQKLV